MSEAFLSQFNIDQDKLDLETDQSVETSGGNFTSLLTDVDVNGKPSGGDATVRFIGYFQTGTHTSGKGKALKTVPRHTLEFEVVTKRHRTTKDVDGESKTFTESITVTLPESSNDKSAFMNYFKRMDYGRGNTNFAQMLGEGYEVFITVNTDGDKKYANIHDGKAGEYSIKRGIIKSAADPDDEDSELIEKPRPIAKSFKSPKLFLWNQPNLAMWESIQIGDHPDDDKSNWIKAKILSAKNFTGSPVEAFIHGEGYELTIPVNEADAEAQDEPEVEVKTKPKPKAKPKTKPEPEIDAPDDLQAELDDL